MADEEQGTSAPYFEYFASGPGHELDDYMALCGTLIYVKGKTATGSTVNTIGNIVSLRSRARLRASSSTSARIEP